MASILSRPQCVNSFWPCYAIWCPIFSGNGWLPVGIKPLPGPIWICQLWGPMAFTWEQLGWNWSRYESLKCAWKLHNYIPHLHGVYEFDHIYDIIFFWRFEEWRHLRQCSHPWQTRIVSSCRSLLYIYDISCKTAVSSLLMHWRYCSLTR